MQPHVAAEERVRSRQQRPPCYSTATRLQVTLLLAVLLLPLGGFRLQAAVTTNCYLGSMYAQAEAYANTIHPNTPPYDCIKLRPAGQNSLLWFPDDQDIDWRSTISSGVPLYLMWRTTIWAGTDPQRDSARLVTYDDSLEPSKRALDLTVENLVLENVELDTDSVTIRLQGDDLTWTLRNALFEGLISFYGPAPLAINVVETNSTIKGVTRQVASVTTLNVETDAALTLFGCGRANTLDPNERLSFNRVGSGADINGGTLELDQSSVLFATGTNQFQLRNGALLKLEGSGSRLDASSVRIDDSEVAMNNNTILHGDELILNDAQIHLSSGARVADFVCRPESGTNLITIADQLGGFDGTSLQMSGSNTVLRVNGSGLPFSEDGNFKNDGAFELGGGTLRIGDDAFYWIRPSGVFLSRTQGRVVVEPGGELQVETSYILDMSDGLELELDGRMTIDGTLVAYGDINGAGSLSELDFPGGSLQLATNASVVSINVDEVNFDTGSKLQMKLDPSGAEAQRLDVSQTLDLSGRPTLQLDLVNDAPLPPGTKIVICDYDYLRGGHFNGLFDEEVFTLGANTWRIRYEDPYYSGSNSSVITLTAGANDPPDPGTLRVYSLFVNSTNRLPVLVSASDPDADTLSIVSVSSSNGVAWIDGDDVVYAPAPDFTGTNVIDYCITDGTFTNCSTATSTVQVYPSATPTNCYASKMSAQAVALNNDSHPNTPPFNCVELAPGGGNNMIWFDNDNDIDWRDIYASYRMWQTAKWMAPAGPRVEASLVAYDESVRPIARRDLTIENLLLENTFLAAGSCRVHFAGGDLSWRLVNAKFDTDIRLDPTAPFAIDVSGGTSELVGVDGPMDSVTTLTVAPDGELILLGCGSTSSIDPDDSMHFYREGSSAEIDGGKLTLDQSWVVFETGTNEFRIANGAELAIKGSRARLDATRVLVEQSDMLMNNNTVITGDSFRMDGGRVIMNSGAALSGFEIQPFAGTNLIQILDHLEGVEQVTLNMSGSSTVLKVKGSDSAYAEKGNFKNEGAFELGGGTLIIQDEAFFSLRPGGVSTSAPNGQLIVEPGGDFFLDDGYHLDMTGGLGISNDGSIEVRGRLNALGSILGASASANIDVANGTLALAPSATTFEVIAGDLNFDSGSRLEMKLDPSGAEGQQILVGDELDLRGYPELQLSLVNDTLLPPGTKIVLCDYDRFEGGAFQNLPDEHVFQQGTNTWRIRYGDPYVSDANTSVITLTAGANDPPIIGGHPVYQVFTDTTNSLPALVGATDPDGDALSLVSAATTNGTVSLAGSNVLYTPPPAYTGTNIIDYCITDGSFTNCGTMTVVVRSYDPNAATSCFVTAMASYVPTLSNGFHPNTPPYNCLELFPGGNNTAFWFDSDHDIDWRDIYGEYRMWQSVKWAAPDGPRIAAALVGYDGDLNTNVSFSLSVQSLALENVDLNTAAIAIGLRGYDLTWELRNARYAVQTYPITFDDKAPLALGVTGGESEIAGLSSPVDSVTAISIAPGATLTLTDCGLPGSTNTGERLDFYRPGATLDVDGGTLKLVRSSVRLNSASNGVAFGPGGSLSLLGAACLLEAGSLQLEGSTLTLAERSRIAVAGHVELTATSLILPVPAGDVTLTNGTKIVLLDYGTLNGAFDNYTDGTLFQLGLNAYRLRYADPGYGDGTAITMTVVPPPSITALTVAPTTLTVEVGSGPAWAPVELVTSTNLLIPVLTWDIIESTVLDASGFVSMVLTNGLYGNDERRFFSIRVP